MKIWKPAWRGGISGLMSLGLTNLSGILYAQIGSSEVVASYMIALRFITEIRNISNAPFYSKIPLMARLRAEGNVKKLKEVAQRGMFIAHIVFSVSVVLVGLFCDDLIKLIGSNIHFVNAELWVLIALAFYAHRYGAMHMQLYLTTNHVIAYIADGISGIIFVACSIALIKPLGIYALPAGMLAGYLGFYVWFAAYYSLRSVNTNFFNFEKKAFVFPGTIFILYCLSVFIFF
jgi:hypothetical protein